jgi:hypothetical protein
MQAGRQHSCDDGGSRAAVAHLDRRKDAIPQRQAKRRRSPRVLAHTALNFSQRIFGLVVATAGTATTVSAAATAAAVKRRAALECGLELTRERVTPRSDWLNGGLPQVHQH